MKKRPMKRKDPENVAEEEGDVGVGDRRGVGEGELGAEGLDGRFGGALDFDEEAQVGEFVEFDLQIIQRPRFAALLEAGGFGEAEGLEDGDGVRGVGDDRF